MKESNKNIVIVILFILLVVTIGYIVYDKVLLDETKSWVYDANYNLPVQKESYCAYMTDDCDKLIKASEIIVPYININSNDAKKINDEIYNLYQELINKYNDNSREEIWYTTVEYKVQNSGDIVSILIITESGGTASAEYEYYTYNFNLNTAKLVSYQDLYQELGYTKEMIESKLKVQITKELNDVLPDDIYPQGTNLETYNNKTIERYNKEVQENKLKYFIDEQNKLNVVITLAIEELVEGTHKNIIVID